MDLERGESDLGEDFTPAILEGYYTTANAPTEVGKSPENGREVGFLAVELVVKKDWW